MNKSFGDSRKRISWAKKDIAHFKKRARIFFRSRPHTFVREMDEKGVYELNKLKLARPLPDAINNRTVNALEHLRSALDLAAYQVAVAANVTRDSRGHDRIIHFPFCAREEDLKSRLNGVCKGFPNEIHALFASFKPYKGGDDLLWALNELCNSSKHRIIAPVVMVTGPLNIEHFVTDAPFYIPLGEWDSEKDGLTIAATTPGAQIKYKMNISYGVAFGEINVVKGKPLEAFLDATLRKVSVIVDATEAECRRIGVIQ